MTRGLWLGGDMGAEVSVGGNAWRIDVDGQMQAAVTVGGDAEQIIADGGGSAAADVTVGGNLVELQVRGEAFDGDLVAGSMDSVYIYTTNGATGQVRTTGGGATDGHLATLTVRFGALQGAVTVAGDLGGLYAYRSSTAVITVQGSATDLYFLGHVSGSMQIGGHGAEIYISGNFVDSDIVAQTLGTVTVKGRIQSTTPGKIIRATAADSTFLVRDRTAQRTVTADPTTWFGFDGGDVVAMVQAL